MYYLNKIVGAVVNPLGIGLLLLLLPFGVVLAKQVFRVRVRFRLHYSCFMVLAIAWLWFWSTGVVGRMLGLSLEREYPPVAVERLPEADAIVVLGGGTAMATNGCVYAEMFAGADRAWQGARIYKAGKASKIFVTGEGDADVMVDFGVPREAIAGPSEARNTEEEAKCLSSRGVKKVLLVTSAWHMRRAKLMFDRYAKGIEVIPAATDHETMATVGETMEFKDFVPDPMILGRNAFLFKEWIAYWGYKWVRR